MKIEFLLPPKQRVEVDDVELMKVFKTNYDSYYVSRDQIFVMNFKNNHYIITVDKIVGSQQGFIYLSPTTVVETFASPDQQIRLKTMKSQKKNVFAADFSMDSLGIGGLDG